MQFSSRVSVLGECDYGHRIETSLSQNVFIAYDCTYVTEYYYYYYYYYYNIFVRKLLLKYRLFLC
jgi:hypothetical protein